MMPTGSSIGANTVRATRSHPIRNDRAEQRRGRQHQPVIRADEQPDQMRDDEADERDRPADRHRRAGGERRADERQPLGARHVDAAGGGRVGRPG